MKLLTISGSARRDSVNTVLLLGLKDVAPEGVELSVFHRLDTLPVFSPDLEGPQTPAEVLEFLALVSGCDGIIIASPEYVRAIPGGLKNLIDWMVSRFEVIGKPIALAHASHRGDDMLTSLRLVLSTVSDQFLEHVFFAHPVDWKNARRNQNPVEAARAANRNARISVRVRGGDSCSADKCAWMSCRHECVLMAVFDHSPSASRLRAAA
ncbi:NADPH-dependent FMN reductase [Ralstonia mannitolilytica]|uniref:NADPH-dependent FMN reductase n=1 Tax=Ralstonia mannitolilytica TaxID=105219 RepID=UPI001F3211C7|nr:NADPH-dependent FMN reductase [Ralstonia mannitolilytica]